MENTNTTNTNEEQPQSTFAIHKLFNKKLSAEVPNGAESFKNDKLPDVSVQLNNSTRNLEDNYTEVSLKISVTAKVGDEVLYVIEVEQAGIFTIDGFNDEQRAHLEGAYCPTILFPYVRETIDNLVTKVGFPPLTIAPVNFDLLYAKRLEQMAAEGNA